MSETTNNAIQIACNYGHELRGAYSNSIRSRHDIESRVRQNASNTWGDPHGADATGADAYMEDWIFSNMEFINPDVRSKATSIVQKLKDDDYHREKVVSMMDSAVLRLKQAHAPNAIYRPQYRQTLQEIRKFVKPQYVMVRCNFKDLDSLQASLTNPQASVGFAGNYLSITKKGQVTTEIFDILKRRVEMAIQMGTFAEPTQVAARIQLSVPISDGELKLERDDTGTFIVSYKQKTRMVNVVSLVEIFGQMQFSQSIQLYFGNLQWYAGGKTSRELHSILNSNRARFVRWISIDYSSYDQSIPGWLMLDCFNIMKEWFSLSVADEKLWDAIARDAIHKRLVVNKQGDLLTVHDGVRSGEMLTNVLDSLANIIMLWYYALLNGKKYGKDWVTNICGDDNLTFHDGWFDKRSYSNFIRKVFGVQCHPDKCTEGTQFKDLEYLSRTWRMRGIWRDPWELIIKLIWHEWHREYSGPRATDPAMVIAAYDQCYPLGMAELFNMESFYEKYPRWSASKMTIEDSKSLTGMARAMVLEQRRREAINVA